MNKQRKSIIAGNEISCVKTYSLGGYPQKVLLDGKAKDLPIVVTLHGGPGSPIPFCAGGRGLFPAFTDQCILVSWDQYGCGINNAALPEDISLDDFVKMTKDLVASLKRDFTDNRIFLFGMSWGSVLAAKAAAAVPALVDGVICYGQVLNQLMRSEDTIHGLTHSSAPKRIKQRTTAIFEKELPSYQDAANISRWIRRYTDGYQNKNEPKANIRGMVAGILTSPDYSLKDFVAMIKNGYAQNRSLMNELLTLDLRKELSEVQVPYYILQGDTDIVTSTKTIADYMKTCDNPFLHVELVENAAHIPGMNGMNAVMKTMDVLVAGHPVK